MKDNNNFIPRHGSPLFYPQDPSEGFQGGAGGLSRRKFLKRTGGATAGEAVWLVEDDVAGDGESFARLVERTTEVGADLSALEIRSKADDAGWYWWGAAEGFFEEPWRSFNPLCCLSGRLVRAILDFREARGRFTFHEVLFASVAKAHGMRCFDWGKDAELKYDVAHFRYRPVIESALPGIVHPVKDLDLVNLLCEAPKREFRRMGAANLSGYSILAEDYVFLARFCREFGIEKVVEFGPGDSTLALRDAGCSVVSYEHHMGWLEKARELLGDDAAVELQFCDREEVPGEWDSADLVLVDGPPQRDGEEMSRLKVCDWAMEHAGCFILHDAKRGAEKGILEIFEKRGNVVWRIPTRKGLALVVDRTRRAELLVEEELMLKGWAPGEWLGWRVLMCDDKIPVKVLGVGSGMGRDLLGLKKALFPHPGSSLHWVEVGSDASLGEEMEGGAEIYEGEAVEVLAWMIAGEGYWESFDFVVLDYDCSAFEILSRGCQAWSLLRAGGMLAFRGKGEGALGEGRREAFGDLVSALGDRLSVVLEGEAWLVRKNF